MEAGAQTHPHAEPVRLAPSVHADLEEIFKDAEVAAGDGRVARSLNARPGSKPPRSGSARRLASLGGVAAAALAGLAAGSLLLKPTPAETTKAAPAPVRLAAAPIPPAQPQPLPKEGYPFSPEPFTPLPATVPAVPSAAVEPAAASPAAKPRPKPRRATGEASRASRSGYANVMAADRRLRAAYARASRAGVDRGVLVSYRNRWDRLRRRASDEPGRLISGYGALTVELDRLASDARHAARRRSETWS